MQSTSRYRRGSVLIYVSVLFVVLLAIASLAVDYGRAQVLKEELLRAADAGARYSAAQFAAGATISATKSAAVDACNDNTADGSTVSINSSNDVEFGAWDTTAKTFTVLTGSNRASANAIRVTCRRTAGSSNAMTTVFASIMGQRSVDVKASATALITPGISVNQNIPATGNPFLSGMSSGAVASSVNPANNSDHAGTTSTPQQSPILATMSVTAGQVINFDSISGDAANGPGITDSGPDGDTTSVGHNNLTTDYNTSFNSSFYNENGIADAKMPINCTVGLFLDNNPPNTTAAPSSNLDFSTPASRDYTTLAPQMKQVFFVGDGLTSGGAKQSIVVPPGATRLFLGTWDFYEWSNNHGSRNVVINRPATVTIVK